MHNHTGGGYMGSIEASPQLAHVFERHKRDAHLDAAEHMGDLQVGRDQHRCALALPSKAEVGAG